MPFQIRDQHGASRAVACLALAAGAYNLVTGVLMKIGSPAAELVASGAVAGAFLVIGVVAWRRPARLPRPFWLSVPLLSAAAVTGLNLATRDAGTGAQLFYLWPLLYAASFLSRLFLGLTVAAISAGHALVVFSFLDTRHAFNDWIAITVAMAMTGFVVLGLRERNERLHDILEHQAGSDPLTGVANRRAFDQELARAVGSGEPVALIMVDVDHFKKINDTWGHATGDRALRTVADALRQAASGSRHQVARLGGDEFAVLLKAGPAAALRYAEDARAVVGASADLPGGPPQLSIGVAVLPDHAATAEDLQRVADAALYQAKAAGRGRSTVAPPPAARHNVDQVPAHSPVRS